MFIVLKSVWKGEEDANVLGADKDRKEPRRDRESDLRSGWLAWIGFVDPCSAGTPTFLEEDGADESPLTRSIAGLKKLKAVGWSKL